MKKWIKDASFLSLVLATLIFCAALFALKLDIDELHDYKQNPSSEHHANYKVANEEAAFLGVYADGWTAVFTGGLFIFTMALAGFTFWLVCITKRGITEQAELTRTSLEHVAKSATATVIAADASGRSAEIAERALVQLERPYVVVINPQLTRQEDFGEAEYFVIYTIINIGKIPALLQSVRISVAHGHEGEPLEPPEIDEDHKLSINPYIAAGEKISRLIEPINSDIWNTETEIDQETFVPVFLNPNEDVWFKIMIEYTSPFIDNYITSAAWLHNTGRFRRRGGTKHNYMK